MILVGIVSRDSESGSSTNRGTVAITQPTTAGQSATAQEKHKTDITQQEAQLALLNRSAIELCKVESVKRQPNAKDYVATGHWFQVSHKDTFHVEVDWTLGYPDEGGGHFVPVDPIMISDCRIARKDDKMTLIKIKFTFAN